MMVPPLLPGNYEPIPLSRTFPPFPWLLAPGLCCSPPVILRMCALVYAICFTPVAFRYSRLSPPVFNFSICTVRRLARGFFTSPLTSELASPDFVCVLSSFPRNSNRLDSCFFVAGAPRGLLGGSQFDPRELSFCPPGPFPNSRPPAPRPFTTVDFLPACQRSSFSFARFLLDSFSSYCGTFPGAAEKSICIPPRPPPNSLHYVVPLGYFLVP